jgi:flagellin-like hook-associated protein FlgL
MNAAMFETEFAATPPFRSPTLSVAGNNVGTVATATNLRPTLPIPIATRTAQLTTAVTASVLSPVATIPVRLMELPPSGNFSGYAGATFLPTQAEVDAYRSSNPTTPAFYLSATPTLSPPPPPVAPLASQAMAPGTTIASVDPARPPAFVTLSSGATANIPAGTQINLLVPLPVVPVMTPTTWGGVEGAVATLNAALRKTGTIGQALGNALNTLQRAQDSATQSVDLLNGGIGNLTDADLGKVSAQLLAVQIQQQLAAQALALDNQSASQILQLFK